MCGGFNGYSRLRTTVLGYLPCLSHPHPNFASHPGHSKPAHISCCFCLVLVRCPWRMSFLFIKMLLKDKIPIIASPTNQDLACLGFALGYKGWSLGFSPDLLNQDLHVSKIPGDTCAHSRLRSTNSTPSSALLVWYLLHQRRGRHQPKPKHLAEVRSTGDLSGDSNDASVLQFSH